MFAIVSIASLLAGFPNTVSGGTINRFCGSSMTGIHYAVGQIAIGAGDAFLCAGVESMTRVPMMGYNPLPNPIFQQTMPGALASMGQTAENLAAKYGISESAIQRYNGMTTTAVYKTARLLLANPNPGVSPLGTAGAAAAICDANRPRSARNARACAYFGAVTI